jgi:acetyl esterase/lipase
MYKKFGWYMATANADDPKACPGISDAVLAKFPPTLYLTGSRDPGSSAAFAAHARMLRLGVDSSLYVIEGAPHALHVVAPETPEAHDANAYIAHWFERHLAR